MTKALTFRENLALQRRGIEADAIPDEILQKFVEDLIAADEPPATTRTVRVVKRDDASPVATTATDPPETTRSLLWRALELDVKEFRAHDPTLTEAQAIVKAMERHPTLVRAYEAAAASGEPPEWDPPARVEKAVAPTSPAWNRVETLATVKLEKGEAPTIEQACELVGAEHPELYALAMEER